LPNKKITQKPLKFVKVEPNMPKKTSKKKKKIFKPRSNFSSSKLQFFFFFFPSSFSYCEFK